MFSHTYLKRWIRLRDQYISFDIRGIHIRFLSLCFSSLSFIIICFIFNNRKLIKNLSILSLQSSAKWLILGSGIFFLLRLWERSWRIIDEKWYSAKYKTISTQFTFLMHIIASETCIARWIGIIQNRLSFKNRVLNPLLIHYWYNISLLNPFVWCCVIPLFRYYYDMIINCFSIAALGFSIDFSGKRDLLNIERAERT